MILKAAFGGLRYVTVRRSAFLRFAISHTSSHGLLSCHTSMCSPFTIYIFKVIGTPVTTERGRSSVRTRNLSDFMRKGSDIGDSLVIVGVPGQLS